MFIRIARSSTWSLVYMELDRTFGLITLGWLIGATLLLTRMVRRGRELASEFASRHPESYEVLGRPRPGYLQSSRRRRFAQFLARREYENLGDPALSAQFEDYRKAEARHLLCLFASLVIVASLIFIVRHVV